MKLSMRTQTITLSLVFLLCLLVTPGIAKPKHHSNTTTPNPAPTSDSVAGYTWLVIIGGAVALLVFRDKYNKKRAQERLQALQLEANEFMERVRSRGTVERPNTSVMLQKGEVSCLSEPAVLMESRAKRVYSGSSARLFKGFYVSSGQSRSVAEMKKIDSGNITLTSHRVVFVGSMEQRTVALKDVATVQLFADAIEISSQKRAKNSVFTVRNPLIWDSYIKGIVNGCIKVEG